MPSPADCTTSDVRTREEYDGPSASILRYRRSRNASFTRSAASVPKDAADRDVRYLTAQTASSVSNASSRLFAGMTTSSPWAVQMAHWSTLTSRFAIMNANSTSASSDSHRATTLAATSLPMPGVRENRRLSNTAHLISATPCHPNGIGGHAPDPVSPIGRIVAPHTTTPAASRPLLSGTSKETRKNCCPMPNHRGYGRVTWDA